MSFISRLWDFFRRRKKSGEPEHKADPVDDLRLSRHGDLCTAIPFETLDWSKEENNETNLRTLHDYAVQLAYSAIDWYIEKKRAKKRLAKTWHTLTYVIGAAAVVLPLAKVLSTEVVTELVRFLTGGWVVNGSNFAAEAALVLIGIAGAFNLLDRSMGHSADWMRYITTASSINRALIEFQFDWDKLSRAAKSGAEAPAENCCHCRKSKSDTTQECCEPTESVARRIHRAKRFCLQVLEMTNAETATWAAELKERVKQPGPFTQNRP